MVGRGVLYLPSHTTLISTDHSRLTTHQRSAHLAPAYTGTLTAKPTSIPKSPVPPRAATGPVNHACCMHGMMSATDAASAQHAAAPRASLGSRGLSQAEATA